MSSRRPAPAALAVAATLLAASGCAGASHHVRVDDVARGDGWTHAANVPEIRQTSRESCGAAALAMVLGHWGYAVTEREIWEAHQPAPNGLRAEVLRDFARGQGIDAFVIQGELADLDRELRRDRPVLVGVMRPEGRYAFKHYEVVVALNRDRRRIVTIDPAEGMIETGLDTFAKKWDAAGRLTLVVLPRSVAGAPVSTH